MTRAADAIKLVRDMVRQRFEPKAIISPGSPGLYDEEFYQALGPLADYHVCNLPWADPKAQMSQALEAAFKPAHPNFRFAVDSFNAGFTFEALLVAADAFKRAGTASGAPLMQAIRETDIAEHVMIGPADPVRREGTESGHPVGLRAEPQPHPHGGAAGASRHHRRGHAGAALAGAQLTGLPAPQPHFVNPCPPSSSMSWSRAC